MKTAPGFLVLAAVLALGCAHNPASVSPRSPAVPSMQPQPVRVATNLEQIPLKPGAVPVNSGHSNLGDETNLDYMDEGGGEQAVSIPDPLEPFNRAMFHFND